MITNIHIYIYGTVYSDCFMTITMDGIDRQLYTQDSNGSEIRNLSGVKTGVGS